MNSNVALLSNQPVTLFSSIAQNGRNSFDFGEEGRLLLWQLFCYCLEEFLPWSLDLTSLVMSSNMEQILAKICSKYVTNISFNN